MFTNPMDILHLYPIRKTRKQKTAFLDGVQSYCSRIGWNSQVETGRFGCRNLILGDPDRAEYLITAHYDTCAAMVLPNFITPCNLIPYIAYQLALYLGIALAAGVSGGLFALITGSMFWGKFLSVAMALGILALFVLGPANAYNANDNTSGVVTVLEILRSLPENQRNRVCFVLFDLEEAGLLGSANYRALHRRATNCQMVINLDCVGDGDNLRFFPTKGLKKDKTRLSKLYGCCGYWGNKSLLVADKGICFYPSDQMNFPLGVGVAALKRRKKWLYLDRIHTRKDTSLDQTNVNILRGAIVSMVTCGAVKKG